jgi:hypothetical protein
MKKSTIIMSALLALAACGGGMRDQVIARSDELSSRPSWVRDDDPIMVKGGDMYVSGLTTIRSDRANVAQGYRMAENSAKTVLANAVKTDIQANLVNAEEGVEGDQFRTEFVGLEKSELSISGLQPANRYWEKVLVADSDGTKATEYRIYVRMKIKETDFKKQMDAFLNKQKGLSANFAKRVDKQVDNFIASKTVDAE